MNLFLCGADILMTPQNASHGKDSKPGPVNFFHTFTAKATPHTDLEVPMPSDSHTLLLPHAHLRPESLDLSGPPTSWEHTSVATLAHWASHVRGLETSCLQATSSSLYIPLLETPKEPGHLYL